MAPNPLAVFMGERGFDVTDWERFSWWAMNEVQRLEKELNIALLKLKDAEEA